MTSSNCPGPAPDETELIRSAMPLARSIANDVSRTFRERGWAVDFDDAYSGALYGVWKAAQKFQADRGAKFTTWAHPWARRYATTSANQAAGLTASRGDGLTNVHSLEVALAGGQDDPDAALDPVDRTAPDAECLTAGVAVREAVAELPGSEREVVFLSYWQGLGPTQVGNAVGLSKSGARFTLGKAHDRLRTALEGVA